MNTLIRRIIAKTVVGCDLGVGSIVGFSGVVAAGLQHDSAGLIPSRLLPLLVGSGTGLGVGLLVTSGHIPSFVATLGVLAGLQGATLVYTNAQPITGLKDDFRFIGTGYVERSHCLSWSTSRPSPPHSAR